MKYIEYKNIFYKHHGILRRSQAINLGIPAYILYEMHKKGYLVKEARGLYRLKDIEPPGKPDLIQISLLIPKSVICLTSALYFHEVTTQIPYKIYIALPRGIKKTRIEYPPVEVVWMSSKSLSTGINEHNIDGIEVKIFNLEKTIADCFKFRNKIGEEIAIEALKDYFNRPKTDITRLIKYSKINRVENIITPYIKSLA